jgi:hypothetical protein
MKAAHHFIGGFLMTKEDFFLAVEEGRQDDALSILKGCKSEDQASEWWTSGLQKIEFKRAAVSLQQHEEFVTFIRSLYVYSEE